MTLTVEDGSGVPGADAYLSAADARTYWDAHGFAYGTVADDLIEAAIRRATVFLEARFRTRWPGRRVDLNDVRQALSWPRKHARDVEGARLSETAIPAELLSASAELASRELSQPYSLSPDTATQRTLSEGIGGAMTTTYANMGDQRPVVVVVDDLLSGLVRQASAGFLQRG